MSKYKIKILSFLSFFIIIFAYYGTSLALNVLYLNKMSDFSYVILQDMEKGNYEDRFLKICNMAEENNVQIFCVDILRQESKIILYGSREAADYFVTSTGLIEGTYHFPYLGYSFECESYQDFVIRTTVPSTQKLYLYNPDGRYFTDIFYDDVIVYEDSGLSFDQLKAIKLLVWITCVLLMLFLLLCDYSFNKKTFLIRLLNGNSAGKIIGSNLLYDLCTIIFLCGVTAWFNMSAALGYSWIFFYLSLILILIFDLILQLFLFHFDFRRVMVKNQKSGTLLTSGYILHSVIIILSIFFISLSQTSIKELRNLLSLRSYFDSYKGRALIQFQFNNFDGDVQNEIYGEYYMHEKDSLDIVVWEKYFGSADIIAANENAVFLLPSEVKGIVEKLDFSDEVFVFYNGSIEDDLQPYLEHVIMQYEDNIEIKYYPYENDFSTMCFSGFDYGDSGIDTYNVIRNPIIVVGRMKKETPTILASSITWNEKAKSKLSRYVKDYSMTGYLVQNIYKVYIGHIKTCIMTISVMALLLLITMVLEVYVCSFLISTETNMKAVEYALLKIQGFDSFYRYRSFCMASLVSLLIGIVTSGLLMYELYEINFIGVIPVCVLFVAIDLIVIIRKLVKWENQNLVAILKGSYFD